MRSKTPHPRIEAAARCHRDVLKLGNVKIAGPWVRIYGDTNAVPAKKCNGQYVIENPKLDEIVKIHMWKGACSGIRLRWIRTEGAKSIGEERYDGNRLVYPLLLEDGSPLVGVYHFRERC